jgi:hypothetical protein
VVIGFGGQANYYAQAVWGYFMVRDGTDAYKHLRGWGGYTGTMGFPFTVEFEGRFYEARR